jgi:hypothetical protein
MVPAAGTGGFRVNTTTASDRLAPLLTPGVWAVVAFTALYLLAALPWALMKGNKEFVLYIGVMFVMIALVTVVHLRVRLTTGVLVCLSVWGLVHMAGGLVPVPEPLPVNGEHRVLYSLWFIPGWLKYDHLVHAFGFGVTTWVCWQGLQSATGVGRPTPGLLLLCGAAGMGFGAINEVVEFFATLLVPETNVGGYINTGWDLVFNALGAAVTCIILAAGSRGGDPDNRPGREPERDRKPDLPVPVLEKTR